MLLQSMAERAAELFAKCFGEEPRWTVAAPGRVNLIGEHTDYNDGFVLPMAIQKYTVMAGRRTGNREVILHSDTTGDTAEFSVRQRAKKGDPAWSNYVRGVVAGFQDRGQKIGGFNGVIDSTLPYGGGLASSAALEVAAATLIEALYGQDAGSDGKGAALPEGGARFCRCALWHHGPIHFDIGERGSRALAGLSHSEDHSGANEGPFGDGADCQHQREAPSGGRRVRQAARAV